jgi:hypothetical protein
MIRKILQREGQFLLQELGAPDARTLWRRVAFLAYVTAGTGIMLGGLVALYSLFGLAAMWLGVVAIYLLHIWLHRAPIWARTTSFCSPTTNRRCRRQASKRYRRPARRVCRHRACGPSRIIDPIHGAKIAWVKRGSAS